MNPNSGFEVDADTFAVESNIFDGLQIRHSVEEDVSLRRRPPVWNRAQAP